MRRPRRSVETPNLCEIEDEGKVGFAPAAWLHSYDAVGESPVTACPSFLDAEWKVLVDADVDIGNQSTLSF
ncbi:MAG: hypothetical protein E5W91_32665 [Mesorhizobium sp.]|uniref:hypothetical protein n=1 Tax=Mesorhizobium sp. TaxID=1871066 RepID=UPI00121F9726|nr:hypothetical protein [Mesorhizobium sp.]TIS53029.1 MAG: hypothetical protein E5W91_32665 [Mesorhizobium sp.]